MAGYRSNAILAFGTLLQIGDGGVGAGTQASRTIGTSNQQIVLRAKTAGTSGNSKTCAIVVSGNNTAFSISVTSSNVTITSATDGSGVATTTVAQAISALYANETFVSNWQATVGAGTGAGVLVAAASAALTGGTDGGVTWESIAEVRELGLPGRERDFVEVTHQESKDGYKERRPGMKDTTEFSITVSLLPTNAGHERLRLAYENGTLEDFRYIFPDAANTKETFKAYVKGITPEGKIGEVLSATISFMPSGPVERVA